MPLHRILLITLLCAAAPAICAETIAYVSIAGESRIAAFQVDENSGRLKHVSDVSIQGKPGSLCVDAESKLLFAAIRSKGAIASFRIGKDGVLTAVSKVASDYDPSYVSLSKTGKHVLHASYSAGNVSVHAVNDAGELSPKAIQTITTDERAHASVFDIQGKFLFVPHTRPNAIFQFHFDQKTGLLKSNKVAKVQTPENTGPRHLWFHPSNKYAYGSNEQGMSVTVYRLDDSSGQLSTIQTLSSLPPEGFEGRQSTSDIEVHPNGKFVYLANRGHNSVTCFTIDQESGSLSYVSNTKTQQTPRSFNIDPDGRFLVVAGQASGAIDVFKIASDGKLEKTQTLEAGNSPWWVQIVRR